MYIARVERFLLDHMNAELLFFCLVSGKSQVFFYFGKQILLSHNTDLFAAGGAPANGMTKGSIHFTRKHLEHEQNL